MLDVAVLDTKLNTYKTYRMNNFIYKNKSLLLKLKRAFNNSCGMEILKYPTPELDRRIKLLKNETGAGFTIIIL